MSLAYKQAGVDLQVAEDLVDVVKPLAKSTERPGMMGGVGGFGALFDMQAAGFNDPLLVAATDGVGTKLRLAIEADKHDTVGVDLVAMCVNDLVTMGAQPLFFLDYLARAKLELAHIEQVVGGIAEGCKQAGCGLIGGETAEMPLMYHGNDYDLAGFAVGAVERGQLLPRREDIAAGDVLLGLASSGLHSNGFSLINRIVQSHGLDLDAPAPFAEGQTLAEALLTPTRVYVDACLKAAVTGQVKAMAHITGGGFKDNLPRVLPDGLCARVNQQSWQAHKVFEWVQHMGNLTAADMYHTFNCGIGMVLVVAADAADNVRKVLAQAGEEVFVIGEITAQGAGEKVVFDG